MLIPEPLAELRAALAADAAPEARLQAALDLVGPYLRADRCFLLRARPRPGPWPHCFGVAPR